MIKTERPLYLNFLDRELGDAVDFSLTHATMEYALKVLMLGTSAPLYCGISLIWENTGLSVDSRRLLTAASEAGALHPVSYTSTVEAFYESRQRLYRHDARRYPLYFEAGINNLRAISPSIHKETDTTEDLTDKLTAWSVSTPRSRTEVERAAMAVTLRALNERDSQALTFSYFERHVSALDSRIAAEEVVRREISLAYCQHYLEFANGDVPTGIAGLGFFDARLSREFPLCDIPLLASLLGSAGLREYIARPWSSFAENWDLILASRDVGAHYRLTSLIRLLLRTLDQVLTAEDGMAAASHFARRSRMSAVIRALQHGSAERHHMVDRRGGPGVEEAVIALESMVARMMNHPQFELAVTINRKEVMNDRVDILLVTATQVETEAVLDAFKIVDRERLGRRFIGENTYLDLNTAGGARVFLVQCEMGSGGPQGATLTINDGIAALQPGAVIMAGIAFGVDRGKQQIGDVLVSAQILGYELQRRGRSSSGTDIVVRGDRVGASPRLLGRCRSASLDWHSARVRFGLLLSGEKLVDDIDYRDELFALSQGEAIGGEMEGVGLYAAAHRRKVDWIVVKGICDWADGRKRYQKERRQALAGRAAANFVHHMISLGGLVASNPGS
ncbi:hypothetical protein AB0C21_08430 [Spirillospora sp. NPDC049024]